MKRKWKNFQGLPWRRLGGLSVMEDAEGVNIQETRHEQRPARMVGLVVLKSLDPARTPVKATGIVSYGRGGGNCETC